MRVLIDTHTFIWFVKDAGQITPTGKALIETPEVDAFMSMASIWEMSIKTAIGKLTIPGGFERVLPDLLENSIEILKIEFSHTLQQNRLPFHHRDPFDRMIAAQALVEGIDLVSGDDVFDRYFEASGVKRIW